MAEKSYDPFDAGQNGGKPRLFDREGMRPSTNVETRSPDDPAEKASNDQMIHDLRNKRALMEGMLNHPNFIFQREEIEAWLKKKVNDPDFNGGFDEGGYVSLPDPLQQQINLADALGAPGNKVKPMPEITAGTGMDRAQPRTTTVSLGSKGDDKINFKVKPTPPSSKTYDRLPAAEEYHGLADSEVPE